MPDEDALFTTLEAAEYLGLARNSVYNFARRGRLTAVLIGDVKHWRLSELEALAPSVKPGRKGRPPYKQQAAVELFQQALAEVTQGQTPTQLLQAMGLTPTSGMRDISAALQRYIARLVIECNAVGVLAADLKHPDFRARQSGARELLAKISPNLKSIETVHTTDARTAERQERVLKVLEEIKAQGMLRRAAPEVRVLEAEEDGEIVYE